MTRACARARQASLAVSADRRALDPAQCFARSARADRSHASAASARGTRGSPIEAVVLTGAEIDQTAGLLSLRERSPFTTAATAATLGGGRRQSDVRRARARRGDAAARSCRASAFALGDGLQAELFLVPGKAAALSRRRQPRHRQRDRGQRRRRAVATAVRGSSMCRAPRRSRRRCASGWRAPT